MYVYLDDVYKFSSYVATVVRLLVRIGFPLAATRKALIVPRLMATLPPIGRMLLCKIHTGCELEEIFKIKR